MVLILVFRILKILTILLGSFNIGIGIKILDLTRFGCFTQVGYLDSVILILNGIILIIAGLYNFKKYFK